MGPGDRVGGGVGDRLRRVAGLGLDQDRVLEEGRAGGLLGELLRELAVGEVEGAIADEPGGGGVPERRRAAVAEHDLVAVGQAEQLAEAVADRADQVADRRLAVRGAHQVGALGEPRERLRADLRGAAAEAAVGRLEVGGDLCGSGRRCHRRREATG